MLDKKPEDTSAYQKDYNEDSFWEKVKTYAKKIGSDSLYYVLILYYVMIDPLTPTQQKILIIGALGYFIFPVDLIPDAIMGIGFTDDLYAIKKVYDLVKPLVTPEHEKAAKEQLEKWFGPSDRS